MLTRSLLTIAAVAAMLVFLSGCDTESADESGAGSETEKKKEETAEKKEEPPAGGASAAIGEKSGEEKTVKKETSQTNEPVALEVGDAAPPFEAKDQDGNLWKSADLLGKKHLVVYFYPAAMTGGCTKQACAYRDDQKSLSALGAEVVGVSGDAVEGLKYFQRAHGLNFPLLSDESGAVAKGFGVPTRGGGSIEREVAGETVTLSRALSASRWTFVVSPGGKVVFKNTKVNAQGDSKSVIAFLKEAKAD